MPFITSENASELGKRSGEARRNKPVSFLVPVPSNHTILEPDIARTVNELLRIVTEQIACTRALLNSEDYRYCEECERGGVEPHHRAQLLKALDNLIERKTILLGIPGPGNLKPTSARPSKRDKLPDPVPIQPGPQNTPEGTSGA
jgi:hypothetical protein